MSHRTPLRSFARDANEEKTETGANAGANGISHETETIAFAVDHSDPVFRAMLMDLELDRRIKLVST